MKLKIKNKEQSLSTKEYLWFMPVMNMDCLTGKQNSQDNNYLWTEFREKLHPLQRKGIIDLYFMQNSHK